MRASKDFRSVAYGHRKRITTPATNFLRPAVGALGLVVGLMALGAAPPATAQPRYTVTDLGTLGGSSSYVLSGKIINNLGQVAGDSTTASGQGHAFRTAPNSPINPATDDLGTLGGCISHAFGINSSGQVVGWSTDVCFGGPSFGGFRTAPNSPINRATDTVGVDVATGINDSGQVVGDSFYVGPFRAFRTAPNSRVNRATDDLGIHGGGTSGINNAGQVIGVTYFTASGQFHAFRTAPNSPINPATDGSRHPRRLPGRDRLPSLQQRIRY